MSNLCEKLLTKCISADCNNTPFTGVDAIGYIFNKSEIASFTFDQDNSDIITAITMKEDDGVALTGFKVQQLGNTPYSGSQTEMVTGNTGNKFNNTVQFILPDNCPSAAKILDNLAGGKFVFVMRNEYEGSDGQGTFQVFGAKKGLKASAIVRDIYSEDTDGMYQCTLTEENAPDSALFLVHKTGSDIDTESYIESLVDCE